MVVVMFETQNSVLDYCVGLVPESCLLGVTVKTLDLTVEYVFQLEAYI